jgi:hypothetical protein
MKRSVLIVILLAAVLVSCAPVDLNAPIPTYATRVDPEAWGLVPSGSFLEGQFDHPASIDYDYEMMVTDVTVLQYVNFLNKALADGALKEDGEQIVGFYPGDPFHGVKHEVEITATDYIFIPLNDPASRFTFNGTTFSVLAGYENHPMTNFSRF